MYTLGNTTIQNSSTNSDHSCAPINQSRSKHTCAPPQCRNARASSCQALKVVKCYASSAFQRQKATGIMSLPSWDFYLLVCAGTLHVTLVPFTCKDFCCELVPRDFSGISGTVAIVCASILMHRELPGALDLAGGYVWCSYATG